MKKNSIKHIIMILFSICFIVVFNNFLYADSLYKNSKKGMEAFEKGEFDKALDHYTAAQLEAPENNEVFYNLGNAQYKTGDYESAMNNYSKVLSSEKKELKQKAYYNLGNTYFRKGDYEESVKQYENAIKLNPNDEQAKKNIEFVKKVIEQQKKQQEQNDDKKDQDKKDQDKKDQDKKDQDKKDQDKKDQDKKDQGKKDQGKKDQDKKDDQKPPEPKPDEKNDDEKQKSEAAKQKEDEEMKDKKQAERMLNRLEDSPGKAMMPSYENKKVEKDW